MDSYLKLIRLDKPAGYLLLFSPAAFAIGLATDSFSEALKFLPLFFTASVIIRGAGCIINDIWDRDYDKYVERTKDRPLASGKIGLFGALVFLFILLSASLLILLSLNETSIYLGFLVFPLIVIYPSAKRFTHFAQAVLALCFNFGALIGYSSVKGSADGRALILYIGCCFWTLGYDTIYGFSDILDDKKLKLKSMPIALEKRNYKAYLFSFYAIFLACFLFAGRSKINYFFPAIAAAALFYQIYGLDIKNRRGCFERFKSNIYVGLFLFLSFL